MAELKDSYGNILETEPGEAHENVEQIKKAADDPKKYFVADGMYRNLNGRSNPALLKTFWMFPKLFVLVWQRMGPLSV